MIEKARGGGLGFDPAAVQRQKGPAGGLHSEFRGFFRWMDALKGKPHGTPRTFTENCARTRQSLHPSVHARFRECPDDPWPPGFREVLGRPA